MSTVKVVLPFTNLFFVENDAIVSYMFVGETMKCMECHIDTCTRLKISGFV
jgi:cytochrome c